MYQRNGILVTLPGGLALGGLGLGTALCAGVRATPLARLR